MAASLVAIPVWANRMHDVKQILSAIEQGDAHIPE